MIVWLDSIGFCGSALLVCNYLCNLCHQFSFVDPFSASYLYLQHVPRTGQSAEGDQFGVEVLMDIR
jgi:hypothetical protein